MNAQKNNLNKLKTNFAAIIAMFTFEKIIIQDEKTKNQIFTKSKNTKECEKKQRKEISKRNKENE